MLTMGTDVTRYFVQTTTRLHRLYGAWVGAMKGTRICLGRQAATTKDTLGNALFLWARAQPSEKLAEMLLPYMDEFDRVWATKDDGESAGTPWLPGAVRDQTSIDQPPPRRSAERPPEVNETRVLPQPRKRKRPEAG